MEIIRRYFPDLSARQISQFSKLKSLYLEWNSRINVISRKDTGQIYLKHVLHSLSIAKYISFVPGTKIMDVGTGGGFPGIPLAILFPDTDFRLVDSVGKKIRVVDAVSRELDLKNCIALNSRAEKIKDRFDFVVSRAVTALPKLISWIQTSLSEANRNEKANGLLALKGGDLEAELNIPYPVTITELSDFFTESFFVTKKLVHVLLDGTYAKS